VTEEETCFRPTGGTYSEQCSRIYLPYNYVRLHGSRKMMWITEPTVTLPDSYGITDCFAPHSSTIGTLEKKEMADNDDIDRKLPTNLQQLRS
jgi:hypothetical protein